MLQHALDGPRLRLDVAHTQLESLKREIGVFIDTNPSVLVPKVDGKTGWVNLHIRTPGFFDPVWGIRAGDILHNLRSALDNLTWQVAGLNPRYKPSSMPRGQFPIWILRTTKKTRRGKAKALIPHYLASRATQLEGVPRKYRALFDRQQPYARGNGHRRDPLWILKCLNDADKHRIIHLTKFAFAGAWIRIAERDRHLVAALEHRVRKRGFKDGAEVARFRYRSDVSGRVTVNVNHKFAIKILFDESCGPASSLVVVKTLRDIHKRVEGIIDSFEPIFPKHPSPQTRVKQDPFYPYTPGAVDYPLAWGQDGGS